MSQIYLMAVVGALLVAQVLGQGCQCNDSPPPAGDGQEQFTCAQQVEFGKCNDGFMLGFCECACDRCCPAPCNNLPPDATYTCKQQKEFGKCNDQFMQGFCECECDRCTPGGTPAPAPLGGCPEGLVPIAGSDQCETNRCAQNRQNCANRCGGLSVIDFDCQDEGGSFGTSCACAGK